MTPHRALAQPKPTFSRSLKFLGYPRGIPSQGDKAEDFQLPLAEGYVTGRTKYDLRLFRDDGDPLMVQFLPHGVSASAA